MRQVLCKADGDSVKIRLRRMIFPVTSLGWGKRLGVWFQGCTRGCSGCISPEMQPVNAVPTVELESVLAAVPPMDGCDGMTVSGGEPFDQPQALATLVRWFADKYGDDVLIYTGYKLEELAATGDMATDYVLKHCAAIVDGEYQRENDAGVGLMGSSNQRLVVFRHEERYKGFERNQRILQPVMNEGRLLFVGVPPREDVGE